jgi:hypothetical protein
MAPEEFAALLVTLEFLGLIRRHDIQQLLDSSTTPPAARATAAHYAQLLRDSQPILHELEQLPDLQPFLPIFRQGLDMKFFSDAHPAPEFARWRDVWRGAFGVATPPAPPPPRAKQRRR